MVRIGSFPHTATFSNECPCWRPPKHGLVPQYVPGGDPVAAGILRRWWLLWHGCPARRLTVRTSIVVVCHPRLLPPGQDGSLPRQPRSRDKRRISRGGLDRLPHATARSTTSALAMTSPPSGCQGDCHPRAVGHARHTNKKGRPIGRPWVNPGVSYRGQALRPAPAV